MWFVKYQRYYKLKLELIGASKLSSLTCKVLTGYLSCKCKGSTCSCHFVAFYMLLICITHMYRRTCKCKPSLTYISLWWYSHATMLSFLLQLIDFDIWIAFCEFSCLLFRGKRGYATLDPGIEAMVKKHLKLWSVYLLTSHLTYQYYLTLVYLSHFFFVKHLLKRGWLPPLPGFYAVKPSIHMILVLEDRYESPLPIAIKKYQYPLIWRMTSEWTFNNVRVTKNWILRIFVENRLNIKFSLKIVGICYFEGISG